jgi:hypothetical protein
MIATSSLSLLSAFIFIFLTNKQQLASGAADTETAQMKKVSLVSSDVLNSYNRAKTDALAAQPVTASSSATSAAAASNVKHFDNVLKLLHYNHSTKLN